MKELVCNPKKNRIHSATQYNEWPSEHLAYNMQFINCSFTRSWVITYVVNYVPIQAQSARSPHRIIVLIEPLPVRSPPALYLINLFPTLSKIFSLVFLCSPFHCPTTCPASTVESILFRRFAPQRSGDKWICRIGEHLLQAYQAFFARQCFS